MGEVRIVKAGAERVGDIEPLWHALVEQHRSVDPRITGVPLRAAEDSWPRRRAEYETWLAEPDAFVLLVEEEGPVGYALVRFHEPDDGWRTTGPRFAELATLVVLPSHRDAGLGGRLMDAVFAELRALGVRELEVGVLETNVDARRFYERYGLRPWMLHYLGRIPDPD